MNRTQVTSSQIFAVGYDSSTQEMEIEFVQHNPEKPRSVYNYKNITQELYDSFIGAPSVGSYFYKHIKPYGQAYPYTKLN